MERQRVRAATKPNPMGRIAAFALALIPVALLFTGVDALLRVFHHINDLYNSPANNPEPAVVEQVQDWPPEPGVVLLEPPKDLPPPKSP